MKTSDFDYPLPPERIAQEPARPRDSSRLLVLDRKDGSLEHKHFHDIGDYLRAGDLLVVNRSKVFKARLQGVQSRPERSGAESKDLIEIFLLHPEPSTQNPEPPLWLALAKPGRKLKPGSLIEFSDGSTCRVMEKRNDGTLVLDFGKSEQDVLALTERIGQVPTPPYVAKPVSDAADYQKRIVLELSVTRWNHVSKIACNESLE